jgi:cell division protein FtsI (penicillin-binding protein 3)
LDIKKDILWRVYLIFLGIVAFSLFIIGKTVFIQQKEGAYWKRMSDSLHLEYRELDAERGTIYSEDGAMLSTSIPYFDVRIDFGADGLREKNGKRFKDNIDSLSIELAELFGDQPAAAYKKDLQTAFENKERYYLLQRNITFRQYQVMRDFHLVKSGRNKSGFVFEDKEKRLTPFGLLANRTIGLAREYIGSDGKMVSKNVGLEKTYDTLLRGENGKRLVRRISGGAFVPIEGSEIEPEHGRDLITTLDVNIQDITENALMKMMVANECTNGTAIVMEVKTGKIKAIANLGRQPDGTYFEDLNYAITKSEPGSTFKLVTMLSVLEDKHAKLNDMVDLEGGVWKVAGRTVYDSEKHGRQGVTIKQAFELSSNVGMAKMAMAYYADNPKNFLDHLHRLKLDTITGVGLLGESKPVIPSTKSKYWSAPTLPWMSFGYNLALTPLHTLMLYNAVANGGKMMKPYLVNTVLKDGKRVRSFSPETKIESVCSPQTLSQLKECLEGVVIEGTGKSMASPFYAIAGKTGTALVANGTRGYADHIYQSSFAGYFPADNPQYSCIVVIKNKPFARIYYGALIAGPVFKEIADKLYSNNLEALPAYAAVPVKDSTLAYWAGWKQDFQKVFGKMNMGYTDSSLSSKWTYIQRQNDLSTARELQVVRHSMPNVIGMGLKDALYMLENMNLKVVAKGMGKVSQQSLAAGTSIADGQTVYIDLN